MVLQDTFRKYFLILISLAIIALFIFAFFGYEGQKYIYVLFTIVANGLLFFGFRKNAIFFDTFIGILFWLGFWLKFTIRVAFIDGQFHEPTGYFDGSASSFDHALLVSSCGLFGLLIASIIREKFIFFYRGNQDHQSDMGLLKFYQDNRKIVLIGFIILFISIALANINYGIYQRATIPSTILPYGISGIFKWLLLFGLASFSAIILKYELFIEKKQPYTVVIISLLETFFSNVSMLSRGMIINAGALGYGFFKNNLFSRLKNIKLDLFFILVIFFVFFTLFISSVFLVNHVRTQAHVVDNVDEVTNSYQSTKKTSKVSIHNPIYLLIDRWVGIEGVMSVSSYPDLGWKLLNNAWNETLDYSKFSFYDEKIIATPYKKRHLKKHHQISLPGIIAFCYYAGSFLFLFVCMLLAGLFAAFIELFVYKVGGKNIILCSLLAMVVAYRYMHFGYVPKQSYLLFGSLFLNVLIIYFVNKILTYWYNRKINLQF